jgi:hypothetical protein
MVVGYLVTIRDRQKLQLMVDESYSRRIFTNVVPNIFRAVGIPVSNVLPTGTSRKMYAFAMSVAGLIGEGASYSLFVFATLMSTLTIHMMHFYVGLGGISKDTFMLDGHSTPITIIGCVCLSWLCSRLAWRCQRHSQRLLLQRAYDIRKFDDRPPILFLRSFADDQISIRQTHKSWQLKSMDFFGSGLKSNTLDELLVQQYSYIGPVIAIGNPNDKVPLIGASRKYVMGESWRELVLSLMKQASLIIIGARDSEHLLWEIHQIGVLRLHRKTVFVLPPDLTKSSTLVRKIAREVGASVSPELSPVHVLSIVYDDCETCLACTTTSERVTGMEYEMAIRTSVRHAHEVHVPAHT